MLETSANRLVVALLFTFVFTDKGCDLEQIIEGDRGPEHVSLFIVTLFVAPNWFIWFEEDCRLLLCGLVVIGWLDVDENRFEET